MDFAYIKLNTDVLTYSSQRLIVIGSYKQQEQGKTKIKLQKNFIK